MESLTLTERTVGRPRSSPELILGLGNPLGGLLYSTGLPSGDNKTFQQTQHWNNFIDSNKFCMKVCGGCTRPSAIEQRLTAFPQIPHTRLTRIIVKSKSIRCFRSQTNAR